VITNSDATWIVRHDYYPFGREVGVSTDGETHKFTGKERDVETGLYNFGARYYHEAHGRFMSVDPTKLARGRLGDPQRLNLYSYVRNNPLLYIDPDGEELKLYIFNNSGYSDAVMAKVGHQMAKKFSTAGVKNVSYTVVHNAKDFKNDGHSKFIEFTSGKSGKFADVPEKASAHNPSDGNPNRAYAIVDSVGKVRGEYPASVGQATSNMVEMGSHEAAKGVLTHEDAKSPDNIMDAARGSNSEFSPEQGQKLQDAFNKPDEADQGVSCASGSNACDTEQLNQQEK
jgi:RHS repeat-associated protein